MAAAIVTSALLAVARTPTAVVVIRIPIPIPGTIVKKIHAIVEMFTLSRITTPMPKTVIAHPSHTGLRYFPNFLIRSPVIKADARLVRVGGSYSRVTNDSIWGSKLTYYGSPSFGCGKMFNSFKVERQVVKQAVKLLHR